MFWGAGGSRQPTLCSVLSINDRWRRFRPPRASRKSVGVDGLQSAIDDASAACDSASSTSPSICQMAKAMGIALVHGSRWNRDAVVEIESSRWKLFHLGFERPRPRAGRRSAFDFPTPITTSLPDNILPKTADTGLS
jgi:hypothetical protein